MSYPQCNHIMSDGMKCKSPALKRQSYCYFHHRYNQRQRRRVQLGGPVGTNQNTGIELPVIESWETIQIGIQEILESLIDSRIDPKRAGLMLYALQLASQNLKMMKYPGISQPNGVTELPEDAEELVSDGAPTTADNAPRLPQSANVGTTALNDLSSQGEVKSGEGSAASPATTADGAPCLPQSANVGTTHAQDQQNRALAPKITPSKIPSKIDPLDGLRKQYPGCDDETLNRFLPHPNDNDTRLYFKETDSQAWIREIKMRRAMLGIYVPF
jgi:hypothetical protein